MPAVFIEYALTVDDQVDDAIAGRTIIVDGAHHELNSRGAQWQTVGIADYNLTVVVNAESWCNLPRTNRIAGKDLPLADCATFSQFSVDCRDQTVRRWIIGDPCL